MRVALYARVSTSDKGQDPELQLSELREYASRRQMEVSAEYVDRCSGSRESRPALNQLLADARRRRFDALLVWKIDRLGRSLKHLVIHIGGPQRLQGVLCQLPRQSRPEYSIRSSDVPTLAAMDRI